MDVNILDYTMILNIDPINMISMYNNIPIDNDTLNMGSDSSNISEISDVSLFCRVLKKKKLKDGLFQKYYHTKNFHNTYPTENIEYGLFCISCNAYGPKKHYNNCINPNIGSLYYTDEGIKEICQCGYHIDKNSSVYISKNKKYKYNSSSNKIYVLINDEYKETNDLVYFKFTTNVIKVIQNQIILKYAYKNKIIFVTVSEKGIIKILKYPWTYPTFINILMKDLSYHQEIHVNSKKITNILVILKMFSKININNEDLLIRMSNYPYFHSVTLKSSNSISLEYGPYNLNILINKFNIQLTIIGNLDLTKIEGYIYSFKEILDDFVEDKKEIFYEPKYNTISGNIPYIKKKLTNKKGLKDGILGSYVHIYDVSNEKWSDKVYKITGFVNENTIKIHKNGRDEPVNINMILLKDSKENTQVCREKYKEITYQPYNYSYNSVCNHYNLIINPVGKQSTDNFFYPCCINAYSKEYLKEYLLYGLTNIERKEGLIPEKGPDKFSGLFEKNLFKGKFTAIIKGIKTIVKLLDIVEKTDGTLYYIVVDDNRKKYKITYRDIPYKYRENRNFKGLKSLGSDREIINFLTTVALQNNIIQDILFNCELYNTDNKILSIDKKYFNNFSRENYTFFIVPKHSTISYIYIENNNVFLIDTYNKIYLIGSYKNSINSRLENLRGIVCYYQNNVIYVHDYYKYYIESSIVLNDYISFNFVSDILEYDKFNFNFINQEIILYKQNNLYYSWYLDVIWSVIVVILDDNGLIYEDNTGFKLSLKKRSIKKDDIICIFLNYKLDIEHYEKVNNGYLGPEKTRNKLEFIIHGNHKLF